MGTIPVHAPASWTLSQLNQLVSQQETVFGPLVGLGADSVTTVLSFNTNQGKPAKHAVIALQVAGVPNMPAGATLVCQGTIFVAGVLQLAAAAR